MVSCCWLVTRHVATSADVGAAAFGVTHDEPGVDDQVSANRTFLQTFVAPVVGWLGERILTDDHLLHSLERYARGAAWFRRDELRGVYEADTSRGEATLIATCGVTSSRTGSTSRSRKRAGRPVSPTRPRPTTRRIRCRWR